MSVGPPPKKSEVAGLERVARPELGGGVVLVLGDSGEGDAGHLVGGLDQTAAVESDAGRLAAPYIRSTDLGEGPVDGDPSGRAGGDRLGLGLAVGLGEVEDLGDVALTVVVGVDGGGEVGAVRRPRWRRDPARRRRRRRSGRTGWAGWRRPVGPGCRRRRRWRARTAWVLRRRPSWPRSGRRGGSRCRCRTRRCRWRRAPSTAVRGRWWRPLGRGRAWPAGSGRSR